VSLLEAGDGLSPLDFSLKKGENSPLFKRFKGFIRKKGLLGPDPSVLVALSGGPDSVCLLHLFYLLSLSRKIDLQAAHLHHGLRGKEADRDAEFSRKICQVNSIPFHLAHRKVATFAQERRMNLQEAARGLRYRFLKDVARREGIKLIATAHTSDDQAEELLLRFIRGSALEGLSGIRAKRKDGIIRPLLFAEKDEILRHLDTYNIPFVTDSSNLASKYTRNRLRQSLIPVIKKEFNPSVTATLSRTAFLLQDDEDVLAEFACRAFKEALVIPKAPCLDKKDGFVALSIETLRNWKPAIQRRVILMALEAAGVERSKILADHLLRIQHIAETKLPSGIYSLPGGFCALRIYSHLVVTKKGFFDEMHLKSGNEWLYEVKAPGIFSLPGPLGTVSIDTGLGLDIKRDKINELSKSGYPRPVYMDAQKISFPIQLRLKRPGDRFRPFGAKAELKLKDFFISRNIPKIVREFIPLVVRDQEIAAVCGVEVGHYFRVGDGAALEVRWNPPRPLKAVLSLSGG